MSNLTELGWSAFFQKHWNQADRGDRVPARVVEEHRAGYRVAVESGLLFAELAGSFRHRSTGRSGFPAVGDWVVIDARAVEGRATIHDVLPRKTKFSRKVAGEETSEQIIAANLETIFVVTSLNADLNLRRIERYLAATWESGALPVVVLSKADLCDNPAGAVEEVSSVAAGVPILVLSAHTGSGMEELGTYLRTGETIALLGSSGVGKSTIINRLLGHDIQAVRAIREDDDRGRHATTSRRLFVLPRGGLLIDTPGMRELQLWDVESGIENAFADIETIAKSCRFRDCRHESEPKCAVRQALETGRLDAVRFESYRKLKKELAYLARKQDALERIEETKRIKRLMKGLRQHYKLKS